MMWSPPTIKDTLGRPQTQQKYLRLRRSHWWTRAPASQTAKPAPRTAREVGCRREQDRAVAKKRIVGYLMKRMISGYG